MFIESVSRDASNERINSIYFCRKHKKPGSVLHKDLNAICSLITQTKWRVYLPFLIWHAFCHVEFLGHVQKQQLKIDRLSIYMSSGPCASTIVLKATKFWYLGLFVKESFIHGCAAIEWGQGASAVIDAASKHIDLGR